MKIHLHSKNGLYTVEDYGRESITLSTKHSSFMVPHDDFKCFAGGDNTPSKEDREAFIGIVKPLQAAEDAFQDAKAQVTKEIIALGTDRYEDIYLQRFERSMQLFDSKGKLGLTNWKEVYDEAQEKYNKQNDLFNKRIMGIAKRVYNTQIDLSSWQCEHGIKFIIQNNKKDYDDTDEWRMCFDPYEILNNFHSALDELYNTFRYSNDGRGWSTLNGGWIKVIGDIVYLYAQSGDYGVYKDNIAIDCAHRMFPGKQVISCAGKEWSDIEK